MTSAVSQVLLALGSNLGDREAALRAAVGAIGGLAGTRVVRVSSAYETEPWGVVDQPGFLNAAVAIETGLELLGALKAIEERLGRAPGGERWGPRVIDIDMVLWGEVAGSWPGLSLPHPGFRRRRFVLAPLAEIAPEAVDPVTGMTIEELAARPEVEGTAIRARAFWPRINTDEH